MGNRWLEIGKPYITVEGEKARLCAEIRYNNTIKILYFEIQKQYREFLCDELSDAFVTGILYFASYNGYSIRCEVPVSERLLYQLNQYFLPTAHKMDPVQYKRIQIKADVSNIKFSSNDAVGTAASGGVDSFYSILSHAKDICPQYKLTHVLVANLFNKYDEEDAIRIKFDLLVNKSENITKQLGLPLIILYTNHHEFLYPNFVGMFSMRICSYALSLQKLFKVYLLSSSIMFQDTTFRGPDSSAYDLFNTQMTSTDNITFYMSGGEKGRLEKIAYIRENKIVKKELHVCTLRDEVNCSECDKCMRTMAAIDMTGDLECYNSIFEISKYKHKKTKYWGKVISRKAVAVYGPFHRELIQYARKQHYPIPAVSYIWAYLIWNPYFFIKNILKRIKVIKKLYYALKIDYLVHGKENAEIYRFGK